jgi:hypothetical protein
MVVVVLYRLFPFGSSLFFTWQNNCGDQKKDGYMKKILSAILLYTA